LQDIDILEKVETTKTGWVVTVGGMEWHVSPNGKYTRLIQKWIDAGRPVGKRRFATPLPKAKRTRKRQIRSEGQDMYYNANIFGVDLPLYLTQLKEDYQVAVTAINALTGIKEVKNYTMTWRPAP